MFARTPVRTRSWLEGLWRRQLRWYELPIWLLLVPAAAAYACVLAFRSLFWRLRRRRANPIVVGVGNLTVGGSGKTPFTIFLANRLSERGLSVGIVSPRLWRPAAERLRRVGFRRTPRTADPRAGRRRARDDGEAVRRSGRGRAPADRWRRVARTLGARRCGGARRRLSASAPSARLRPSAGER